MTGNSRSAADPIERTIEAALAPGHFIDAHPCFSFVSDLEEVKEQIAKIEHGRAAALYESFIAGCYEKGNEVDDSSGSLGMFVTNLFCGWVKVRQAAGADPATPGSRQPAGGTCGCPASSRNRRGCDLGRFCP